MRAVILAGGSGTRLWPLSREKFAKQFIPLLSDRSLLQETVERVRPLVGDDVQVVAGEDTRFLVADQLRALGLEPEGRIVSEPAGRNTAPAIGLAALLAAPDQVLVVLPSDHAIRDAEVFRQALESARPVAEAGRLVTFGITPASPETGYGYLRLGDPLPGFDGFHRVDRFVEKPDRATAEEYLAEGGYAWNSGMFAFRAGTLLEELAEHAPEVLAGLQAGKAELEREGRISAETYGAIPKISIDYAVMERSREVAVRPVDPGWSDLGSFASIADLLAADGEGNATRVDPPGSCVLVDSRDNLVLGSRRVVALVGMEDTVVVDTPDAVLICARERAQQVKEVVDRLREAGREEATFHRTVHRPWGSYTVMEEGERYKVKRIVVHPGARLSLQLHHHRSEHWVVVSGTARITKGDEVSTLRPNESTFIPVATRHRLENPGTIPLQIIEVQNGEYLGEDDIVRFRDDYGRSADAPAG